MNMLLPLLLMLAPAWADGGIELVLDLPIPPLPTQLIATATRPLKAGIEQDVTVRLPKGVALGGTLEVWPLLQKTCADKRESETQHQTVPFAVTPGDPEDTLVAHLQPIQFGISYCLKPTFNLSVDQATWALIAEDVARETMDRLRGALSKFRNAQDPGVTTQCGANDLTALIEKVIQDSTSPMLTTLNLNLEDKRKIASRAAAIFASGSAEKCGVWVEALAKHEVVVQDPGKDNRVDEALSVLKNDSSSVGEGFIPMVPKGDKAVRVTSLLLAPYAREEWSSALAFLTECAATDHQNGACAEWKAAFQVVVDAPDPQAALQALKANPPRKQGPLTFVGANKQPLPAAAWLKKPDTTKLTYDAAIEQIDEIVAFSQNVRAGRLLQDHLRSARDADNVDFSVLNKAKAALDSAAADLQTALASAVGDPSVFSSIAIHPNAPVVQMDPQIDSSSTALGVSSFLSPQVGIAAGISLTHGQAPWAVPYLGAVLYCSPIDRAIRPGDLVGSGRFRQRVGVTVAFAASSSSFGELNRTISPLTPLGHPVVGLSIRAAEFININAGFITYYIDDGNPLTDQNVLDTRFLLGASLDADVWYALKDTFTKAN